MPLVPVPFLFTEEFGSEQVRQIAVAIEPRVASGRRRHRHART